MGLVKTRRLKYPPLAGADDPWGSRQAERCECRAMQKQQRAKAGMKPPMGKIPREKPGKGRKCLQLGNAVDEGELVVWML